MNPFKAFIRQVAMRLAPGAFWRRRVRRLHAAAHEDEIALLSVLCRPGQAGLDVGASAGIYSVKMSRLVSRCVAFEPRPRQAHELRLMALHAQLPIEVEEVAVSDAPGYTTLHILLDDSGRSMIEPDNALADEDDSASETVNVATRTLDSYGFAPVGFVKVDMEGHELAVLQGAGALLRTQRPHLLVEVEDRHRAHAVRDVCQLMADVGYSVPFNQGGRLRAEADFDPATHQAPRNIGGWKSGWRRHGVYINNFISIPNEDVSTLRRRSMPRWCRQGEWRE
jgi:FkbM family methyltransferase